MITETFCIHNRNCLRDTSVFDLIWSLKLKTHHIIFTQDIQVYSILYDHYERSEGEAQRTTVRWRSEVR